LLMMGFGLLLLHCECVILDRIYHTVVRKRDASGEANAAPARPLAVGSS
jgi:hypothetical protein